MFNNVDIFQMSDYLVYHYKLVRVKYVYCTIYNIMYIIA